MQIGVLNGIYTSAAADFRRSYPRNLVPVPVDQGISKGYLRPADGIAAFGTGPGVDRGGINWDGVCYRVMGTKLVRVAADGAVTTIGDVGGSGQVTMDYSFDRLAIASGGRLYYWDGSALTQVTDPDLGTALDVLWVDGYFMTTDGEFLVVTELDDPTTVNPLKYGSSEADPDPVVSLLKLRNEVYALNRHTIEVFDNVGGELFPFQRIEGAQVPRGCIGTHACNIFMGSIAFLGSGRNEAPAVWLIASGNAAKISTREIDQILAGYTEAQLADVVMEARVDNGHQQLLMHLPDVCWIYDGAASQVAGEPVWYSADSGLGAQATYRARNLVWCYDRWTAGDPTAPNVGTLVDTVSSHYGEAIGWDFGTLIVYNESRGAIFHALELVGLPGRVAFGADPTVWTSYSIDGETWSQERPARAGTQGQRDKRIAWRRQGHMRNWRIQRFRGTSDAHLSIARLEAQIEPLAG
jgi:hypothetical protein